MIIGLHGRAGSGKSTAAAFLVEHYSFHEIDLGEYVAVDLANALSTISGLDAAQILGEVRANKPRFRVWLQEVGAFMREAIPDHYTSQLVAEIDLRMRLAQNVVVSNLRYPTDATAVLHAGGTIWQIIRPELDDAHADWRAHASERHILPCHAIVRNTGTVYDFRRKIRETFEMLESGRLRWDEGHPQEQATMTVLEQIEDARREVRDPHSELWDALGELRDAQEASEGGYPDTIK